MPGKDAVLVALPLINGGIFTGVGVWAVKAWRRADSPQLQTFSQVCALVCAALVLGSLHRLGLQAYRLGWLDDSLGGMMLTDFQLAKSVVAAMIGVAAIRTLKRFWSWMEESERVLAVLTGRTEGIPDVSLVKVDLTEREREVLALVGRGRIKDREIADELFISHHTARTHIRNILRKTGLSDRRELILISKAKSSPSGG